MRAKIRRKTAELMAGGVVWWSIPAAPFRPTRLALEPLAFVWEAGDQPATPPASVPGAERFGRIIIVSVVAWLISIAVTVVQMPALGSWGSGGPLRADLPEFVTGLVFIALAAAPFTAAGAILVTPLTVWIARRELPGPGVLILAYGLAGYAAGLLIFGAISGDFSRAQSSALLAIVPAAAYGAGIWWGLRPRPPCGRPRGVGRCVPRHGTAS